MVLVQTVTIKMNIVKQCFEDCEHVSHRKKKKAAHTYKKHTQKTTPDSQFKKCSGQYCRAGGGGWEMKGLGCVWL